MVLGGYYGFLWFFVVFGVSGGLLVFFNGFYDAWWFFEVLGFF